MSPRFTIQAAILASVLVTAALATWAANDRITAGARREADRQAGAQTARVRALYEQRAATLAAEGEAVSLYPAVIAALADGDAHPLLQWSGQVAALQGTHVTVTDADGRVIARSHAPGRAGDDLTPALEGLRLALAGQKASGTEAGDELGLAVRGYAPVLREGKVVGAVMLADPVDERLLGRLGGAGQGRPELRVGPPLAGDDGCDPPVGAAATCRFGLPSPAARPAATLALMVPLSDVEQARAEAQRTVGLAGAVVLVLGALGAWMLSRPLTTSLAHLTRAADRVAGGAYDQPVSRDGDGTEAEPMGAALVSNVSHELRAPLTAIKGYVDTLLHGGPWDPETEQEFLQIVADSADRLAGLVDNLLDAAKVEAGVLSLEREPVRVERVARQVVFKRRPLLPADHSLEVEIGPERPLAYADPARVEQVIVNLVENAIKYSPDGGPIVVGVRCGADAVVVSVADRGVGVAPEDAERLFDRFYRVGGGRAGRPAGLGLGLFVCKSLVEAHGGRIWVESDGPGRGSTFAFTLPRLPAAAEQGRRLANLGPAGTA